MTKRIANEIVFWMHFLLIPLWIAFSVWAAPVVVLIATAGHQLHLKLFRGCALSHLQRRWGGLQEGRNFFETFSERVFKHPLTPRQLRLASQFVWIIPVVVSVFRITF